MANVAIIFILSPSGYLVLQRQRREPDFEASRNVTAWGRVCKPGERPVLAAIRTLKEELRLSARKRDLTLWRRYKKTKAAHGKNESIYVFTLDLRIEPSTLTDSYILKSSDGLTQINLASAVEKPVIDFLLQGNIASDNGSVLTLR